MQDFRARGWWRDGSAAALLDRWAAEDPTRTFVSDGTVELDYGTTRARAHRIGAVTVPIMTVYRHTEVAHVLRNSGAVAAVTTGEFRAFDHAGMFRAPRAECPELRTLVIARVEAQDGELAVDDACAGETVPDDAVLGPHRDPDLPHLIVYTSGSESTAKGCVHTWIARHGCTATATATPFVRMALDAAGAEFGRVGELPERFVLVDTLPMTATGKVQKFLLRELARG